MSNELYKKDQEFVAILRRADRSELCNYRNLVVSEINDRGLGKRRGAPSINWEIDDLKRKLDTSTQTESDLLTHFVVEVLLVAFAVFMVWHNYKNGNTFWVVAFSFMAVFYAAMTVTYLLAYLAKRYERKSAKDVVETAEEFTNAFFDAYKKAIEEVAKGDPEAEAHLAELRSKAELEKLYRDTLSRDSHDMLLSKRDQLCEILGF